MWEMKEREKCTRITTRFMVWVTGWRMVALNKAGDAKGGRH